ncbi:MAG: acyl-CoA dehydrogenase, partial [Saprospiraceae bacterium]|nr:acyl-CoA dehydrogenase [Saprospiraceae bacterium]
VSRNKLNKMGLHSSDTAEVYFDNVRVPLANVVGEEGKGFYYIMDSFQLERLVIGMSAIGANEQILEQTLRYMSERETFGRPINKYQVLRHTIAQLAAEVEQNKQFVYHTCWLHENGEYVVKECSMIKLLSSELNKRVVDECLQMFGGYGYVEDFPICQAYRDTRVGTIAGGTTQIMREIIAKIVIDGVNHRPAYEGNTNGQNGHAPETRSIVAKEIVKTLATRFRPEKAADYQTIIHYHISGDNGGQYTVMIANGLCEVIEGLEGQAKCLIEVADSVYEAIETGQSDPQSAFMNGQIKVSDVGEMMHFTRVFKKLGA